MLRRGDELAVLDIIPSESDGLMYNRAVDYVMTFHFKALSKFANQVPQLKLPHIVSPQ